MTSISIAWIESALEVTEEVKTAIGVHLIREPLLSEFPLFILALSIASLAVGYSTHRGTNAALVAKPISKGGD